jgi:hypothetical protein
MPLLNKQQDNQAQEKPGSLIEEAKEILYGDEANFQSMYKMFKEGGPEMFAENMANVVTSTLERLESDHGELPLEVVAQTAVDIFTMVINDLTNASDMFEVTEELALAAMKASKDRWAELNPERWDEEAFQQSMRDL